jgi:hypothetical protein
MQTLGQGKLHSFTEGRAYVKPTTNYNIRAHPGLEVQSYPRLVEKVAELSFYNPEQVLFFRGQKKEFTTSRNNTSIKPSIFRPVANRKASPDENVLQQRYARLRHAEELIIECFRQEGILGRDRVTRSRILQWAIIQHYEICGTPLLDVTHSLRVAASFATLNGGSAPVLYVLAAPYLGGTISASSEQGIQTIKLSSICPPDAQRPHFQEGYLLGEYPELTSLHQKQRYKHFEIDFGLRLLAKFHLKPAAFWNSEYRPIPQAALFPNQTDPLFRHADSIRQKLSAE